MSRAPWPPTLDEGETLIAQGQPPLRRRLIQTAWVVAIATTLNTAIEAWQGTVTAQETLVFMAVFGSVYLTFAVYFQKGDHWCLTDRRLVLRRGSTLLAEEVASVTPLPGGLAVRSRRNATWRVEPVASPEATAQRLNWGKT